MKFIFWLTIILALLFGAAYVVLDFYGYYIEWKKLLFAIAIIAPIIQGIRSISNRPEKALLDESEKNLLSYGRWFNRKKSSYESRLKNIESKIESIENQVTNK
jgi:hypothetical protein